MTKTQNNGDAKDYKFKERRIETTASSTPYRTEYEVDKGRIIHSEAFRRLQSKTQVLQTSESDFHRNRLTHSIEVAQIGRGISRFIEERKYSQLESYYLTVDHDLIEAICLAHDIGHPPFGHGGEIALNYMMRKHGGFEGNGQTLRIISKLGKYSQGDGDRDGLNLTRRAALGVLKYPCSYSELWNVKKTRKEVVKFHELNQEEWKVAKGYFDDDQVDVNWILSTLSSKDRDLFSQRDKISEENSVAKYKSFDCSIMDIADDISYAVHDFEDGYELGMFESDKIEIFIKKLASNDMFIHYLRDKYGSDIYEKNNFLENPKRLVSDSIGFLICHVEIKKVAGDFECSHLQYNAKLNCDALDILKLFKDLVMDNIILSPHSQQLVKNGQIIVCSLFDVFSKNENILPNDTRRKFDDAKENERHRVICDYIAGMTDRYALKMYSKIFGSEIVSFFEK